MYFTHLVKSYEEILREVDQLSIWQSIFKSPISIGQKVCSPFRFDRHPNCYLTYFNGNLVLVDWKQPKNSNLRSVGVVQAIRLLKKCSYSQALEYILRDFELPSYTIRLNPKQKKSTFEFRLEFQYRNYKQYDADYWGKIGVSLENLEYEQHNAIQYYFSNSKIYPTRLKEHKAHPYAYGISINNRRKLYQPYLPKERGKFLSSLNDYDIGGLWDKESKVLGIVTSFKDYDVCKYNTPYNYSFVTSENSDLNYFFTNIINDRFDHIFILGDNDDTGKKFNKRLTDKIGRKSFSFVLPTWNDPAKYFEEENNINVIEELVEEKIQRNLEYYERKIPKVSNS